jgi:hypothetical protein
MKRKRVMNNERNCNYWAPTPMKRKQNAGNNESQDPWGGSFCLGYQICFSPHVHISESHCKKLTPQNTEPIQDLSFSVTRSQLSRCSVSQASRVEVRHQRQPKSIAPPPKSTVPLSDSLTHSYSNSDWCFDSLFRSLFHSFFPSLLSPSIIR